MKPQSDKSVAILSTHQTMCCMCMALLRFYCGSCCPKAFHRENASESTPPFTPVQVETPTRQADKANTNIANSEDSAQEGKNTSVAQSSYFTYANWRLVNVIFRHGFERYKFWRWVCGTTFEVAFALARHPIAWRPAALTQIDIHIYGRMQCLPKLVCWTQVIK